MMAPRASLTFNAETHTYRVGRRRIASVTQVLSATLPSPYAGVPPRILETARVRGNAVDAGVQRILRAECVGDEEEDIAGYLLSYQRWVDATGWRSITHQLPLYDPELDVAGTPDEVGWLQGRVTIMDWKAVSKFLDRYRPQVAAYGRMWTLKHPSLPATQGRVLLLQADGRLAKSVSVDLAVSGMEWLRIVGQYRGRYRSER